MPGCDGGHSGAMSDNDEHGPPETDVDERVRVPEDAPEPGEGSSTGDTTAAFREKPDEATIREIEEERQERLDPENRPRNAEIDNTHRDFDPEQGAFDDDLDQPPAGVQRISGSDAGGPSAPAPADPEDPA